MNDNAIATVGTTNRMALGGLAQRLVQDGLLEESAMQDAVAVQKFRSKWKVHCDAVPMFSDYSQRKAVLEGHAGMIALSPCLRAGLLKLIPVLRVQHSA